MRTVILKNITSEGPGTIADYLYKAGLPYDVLEPEEVPSLKSLDGYDALVVLGGPMAVYEAEGHHQVEASVRLIKEALERELKVLGVCLGAQLMAHALGARVYKGPGGIEEIGWMDIELTEDGLMDPVLNELSIGKSRCSKVFQWHGDTFDLPGGAVLLAGSGDFPMQAFRMGERAYALQFHIEVTAEIVRHWSEGEPAIDPAPLERKEYEAYLERARGLYSRFFGTA